ncbi:hypothetical protein DUNSADRAFT_12100 [Dunaliella salina]|uniref:Encoded protein n=1 Tax=Dunaliella salina TaxID=3046 RepID=A0ABQ7H462_DUNSA|nr:hypothetical protein DUNSADRAFT_12100 [Dunaliella salina]|eukprot:KAF5841644.1 hypothetical protein DUNSADRAFT_12100 [Dunaliella salina]
MALAAKPKVESQASKLLPWDSRSPLSVAAAILYAATIIKAKVGGELVCRFAQTFQCCLEGQFVCCRVCQAKVGGEPVGRFALAILY